MKKNNKETLIFKKDDRFKIELKKNNWVRVLFKDKVLAIVIDKETAYQVIFCELKKDKKEVEFITNDDFI